ncbi:MAG: DNA-binding protein [Actinomycetales bacterium]|nr:MAG: DNA-binding protein [Actinomycetales bacterium]
MDLSSPFTVESKNQADALLTIPGAANYSGLTDRSIKHLIYTRQVAFVHVGRRIYLRRSVLDQLIENGTQQNTAVGTVK